MFIAIISDSHDNIPNIDKMLGFVKKEKIKTILHCGDVCAPSVLKYIAENFNGQIYLVYGNVDGDHETMEKITHTVKNITLLGNEGSPKISNLKSKIFITHYPIRAKEIAQTGEYDYIFYGHNHKPWQETIGTTVLLNPGTLAGLFQKATFAVWDTNTNRFELKILELM